MSYRNEAQGNSTIELEGSYYEFRNNLHGVEKVEVRLERVTANSSGALKQKGQCLGSDCESEVEREP